MAARYDFEKAKSRTLGQLIDDAFKLRDLRKAAQSKVDDIKKDEGELEKVLISLFESHDIEKSSGRKANGSIRKSKVPHVVDWDKLYKHIKKTGQFELLQRRASVSAYREVIDDGGRVPGVKTETLRKVSLTKR
jgi:hypothetical protein